MVSIAPCVRRSVVRPFPFFSLFFFPKNVRDLGKTFAAAAAAATVAGDVGRPVRRQDPQSALLTAPRSRRCKGRRSGRRRRSDRRLSRCSTLRGPSPIARFVIITEYELVYRHPFMRPKSAQDGGKEGRPLCNCTRASPPTRACSRKRARRMSGSTRPTKNHRVVRPVAGQCGPAALCRRSPRHLLVN